MQLLNLDTSHEVVSYPEDVRFKRFEIITPVLRADAVFNLCKLKTHSFMHMTCAVKNLFGMIAGLTKPGYHAKLREKAHFANMLLDLAAYVSPRLHIMDAVVGMEGNGPHNGEPRRVGLLLGSPSALALDVAAGEIIGLPKENNPVLVEAQRRGMSPVSLDQVELVGMDKAELRIPGFKLPPTIAKMYDRFFSLLYPVFKNGFSVKPRVLDKRCVSCGACRDTCPMHVITIAARKPPPGSKTRASSAATAATRCARMTPSSSTPVSCTASSTGVRPTLRIVSARPSVPVETRERDRRSHL